MSEKKALQSWKEIAEYLNRGVRTVQRWEQGFGLPIHRPAGRDRSAVLAIPEELDAWMAKCPTRSPHEREELEEELRRLRSENRMLAVELERLRERFSITQQLSKTA